MKIQIGYGPDIIYGTIEDHGETFVYDGENVMALQNLVESMQRPWQSPQEVIESMVERLHSRTWAKKVE